MCFELEDCQDIFCALFTLMFKIVKYVRYSMKVINPNHSLLNKYFNVFSDEHSSKVKSFMLDVLGPLIKESDVVSNELLDIILINIVDPYKTQRKNAYLLAKELVVQTSKNLEPYIHAVSIIKPVWNNTKKLFFVFFFQFFNQQLILDKEERELNICSKVYELIYELNHICPDVLITVLPQLECKLKSAQENERLRKFVTLQNVLQEQYEIQNIFL